MKLGRRVARLTNSKDVSDPGEPVKIHRSVSVIIFLDVQAAQRFVAASRFFYDRFPVNALFYASRPTLHGSISIFEITMRLCFISGEG